jgi:hypothetical protein
MKGLKTFSNVKTLGVRKGPLCESERKKPKRASKIAGPDIYIMQSSDNSE